MLFRLVYYSRNLLKRPSVARDNQLLNILKSAERNNLRLGVTGALLFDNAHFAQVLEGDRSRVTELFVRISQDPRHSGVNLVDAKPVSNRRFPDWSMTLIEYPAAAPFGPACLSGDELVELTFEQMRRSDASVRVSVPVW